jgi:hypothetical protein
MMHSQVEPNDPTAVSMLNTGPHENKLVGLTSPLDPMILHQRIR